MEAQVVPRAEGPKNIETKRGLKSGDQKNLIHLMKILNYFNPKPVKAKSESSKIRIFISHSSLDADLAEALAHLLLKALHFPSEDIRCTSVDGFRLPVGVNIDQQLRLEIEESEVLLALVTDYSLDSTYVLFELGARWILGKPLMPLLGRGATAVSLKEPLKALAALSCDHRPQIYKLIEDLGKTFKITPKGSSLYDKDVEKVMIASRQRPAEVRKLEKVAVSRKLPELNALEIFCIQNIDGLYGPGAHEIIANSIDITEARARQALESARRKGMLSCIPLKKGGFNYRRTQLADEWLLAKQEG